MVTLSKLDRWELKQAYSCRCAYCGTKLGDKWHVDHVKAVRRNGYWRKGVYVQLPTMAHPERDNKANLMPACVACNIDKSDSPLEAWRKRLERSAEVLTRNYSTYRHARRFKLILEAPPRVVFFFERMHVPRRARC